MRQGVPHTEEWFARFRKQRPACLICKKPVKKMENRLCSVSCSNLYKYQNPENHPNWRGGATSAYKTLKNKMSWKLEQWRNAVLERDNYECVQCGATKDLQADHIKSFRFFPELRLELSNGRTLCKPCHYKTPNFGVKVYSDLILTGGDTEAFWQELLGN